MERTQSFMWIDAGAAFPIAPPRPAPARTRLDLGALMRLRIGHDADFREPLPTILEGATAGRAFPRLPLAPPELLPESPEDLFTGSATGCMAAYPWAKNMIEKPNLIVEQGHWLDRPGGTEAEALGPCNVTEGVMVSGSAVVAVRGQSLISGRPA